MTLDEERQERREHLVSRCDMSIEDIKSDIDFILGRPNREWVGLTDYETDGLIHSATYMDETDLWHLVSLVEERLKEKNNG